MPVALPIIAGAGLIASTYFGVKQEQAAKKGLRLQDQAQNQAEAAAASQARQAQEDENRARQRAPDLSVILGDQLTAKPGKNGIDADRLLLGRPGLLGY